MSMRSFRKKELRRRWIPFLVFTSFVCGSFLGLLVHPAQASSIWYVSTTGSDANDGTASDNSHALLTLEHALVHAGASDDIILMSGTYTPDDTVSITESGSSSNYFTISAYPGATVVINGTNSAGTGSDDQRGIIEFTSCTYVRFSEIIVQYSNMMGIVCISGNSHIVVDNCTITQANSSAFKVKSGQHGIRFIYNIVTDCFQGRLNRTDLSQETISISDSYDFEIAYNTIYNNRAENIDIKSGSHDVRQRILHHIT